MVVYIALLTFVFVAALPSTSTGRRDCYQIFETCKYQGRSLAQPMVWDDKGTCVYTRVWIDKKNRLCINPRVRTRTVVKTGVRKYCDGDCRPYPSWCAWTEWTSKASCGLSRQMRQREQACHNVTGKHYSYVKHPENEQQKRFHNYKPCETTSEEPNSSAPVSRIVWVVCGGAVVVLLISCFTVVICCTRKSASLHRRNHVPLRPHPGQGAPSAIQTPPTQPLQPSAPSPQPMLQSDRFIQPSAPPASDDPPTYSLCRQNTLPPAYDDAVAMTT